MVPYLDLKAQYASISGDIQQAICSVLESSQFVLGRFVAEFEESFAEYCGVKYAVAVNSGTSALHLALLAAGVQAGDEVITVPFTFIASVATVRYCGATPVLVDIHRDTCNIDESQIEAKITSRTKAIVPVHLYGQPAAMDPILALGKKHGIPVIEDAAQAHGAEYNGKRTGGLGLAGCFSFYPTKNLGAYGEGGMVTTDDAAIAERLRMFRDWGADRKYHHVTTGFNYRMEGLQGAILNVKLRHLEQWTEARRKIAAAYDHQLTGLPLGRPCAPANVRHVYHTYTIRTGKRDALQQHLARAGIQTAIHYPIPAHLQPVYADLGYGAGSLPESERAAQEVLSLPIYPEMPMDAVAQVCSSIRSFFERS